MKKYIDADKIIDKIQNRIAELRPALFSDISRIASEATNKIEELDELLTSIFSFQKEKPEAWIKISKDHPLPYGQEVIGYNKEWVDEDFNPSGTRIGFLSDVGFHSAKWNNDQDCYDTPCEEGDDYIISQIQPDGTKKIWCKYENGMAVEGYLPNMPTHFMLIPKTPDGFAWPYNIEKER